MTITTWGWDLDANSTVLRTLPSLTGLRFAAAFVVFGTHAWWRISDGQVRNALGLLFVNGFAGVSFFFILSGFILVWSMRDGDTAKAFYRRRAARVLPAYFLALVLALVWAIFREPSAAAAKLLESAPSFLLLQSWIPVEDVYYGGNLPGWSLSDEAFFYLLFPALVLLLAPIRRRWVAVAVAVAVLILVPVLLAPTAKAGIAYWAVYILPASRIAEFVLGMSLGLLMRSGWRFPLRPWLALVIAVAVYFTLPAVPLGLRLVAVMTIPFLIVVGAYAQADLDRRGTLFSHPVAVRLGSWSYAIYLLHFTVLGVVFWGFSSALGTSMEDAGTGWGVAAILVSLALSIAAAGAMYVWFEAPLERRLRGPRQAHQPGASSEFRV